jgi:CheY-like chemotaxis protein
MSDSILHSWKEIARYLGCGVRTVQRWEHDLGLPVRRPRGEIRSAVIALTSELDAWLATTAVRRTIPTDSILQPTLPVVAVIDDSDSDRYALALELARAGFSVVEAASGAAALRLARAVHPDVAFIDLEINDVDGLEVCRQIKRDALLSRTAVALHTDRADLVEIRERAQHFGADAVFRHPLDSQELVRFVRKCVQPFVLPATSAAS